MNEENGTGTTRSELDPSMWVSAEEQKEIDKLRKLFNEDLGAFLLDNILLSVQFFDNYERDITQMKDQCLEETSLESDQFACLEADSLHALVAKKVTFQKKSKQKKNITDLIHPLRIFVTYKNVELASDLSSLSTFQQCKNPYYKLVIQRCEDDTKEESGYVNIIDSEIKQQKTDKYILGSEFEDPKDVFQNPDDETTRGQNDQTYSGTTLSQNESSYYLEPHIRSKPYPIRSSIYKINEKLSSPISLPKKCFKAYEKKTMPNERRRRGMLSGKQPKVIQNILISSAFKWHFTEVFMECLWQKMRFDRIKCETATFHYDHITIRDGSNIYHIIPVLEMKSCYALDLSNSRINNKNYVEWPTDYMKETIQNSGCSFLPMGYYEASNEKNDYTLEWKVIYPKAEKYLVLHMMHTHVKCYLFALILYKSFIEKELDQIHFGPTHILNLLFLMVQNDFLGWPEYKQGETLIKFLKILHDSVQSGSLRYFFLHTRNLYATSPLRVLHKAQTLLKRMVENPIPYILKALMNLNYKEDFYPVLDYLKLYNILTVENLNDYLYPKEVKKRKNKPQVPPPIVGVDTIDEDQLLTLNRTQLLDIEVLSIFANLYIGIANRCQQNEAYNYAMLYLTYAKRLMFILSEMPVSKGEIKNLNVRITKAITRCQNSQKLGN